MDSKTIYILKYHIPKKEFKNQFIDLIFKEVKNKEEVGDNKHIQISNSATYIEEYAYQSCNSLKSITIPNSVTFIGNNCFYNFSSLTSITIPNSVTYIGYGAFWNCTSLRSITIPNSVISIGMFIFVNCIILTSITIPIKFKFDIECMFTYDDLLKMKIIYT